MNNDLKVTQQEYDACAYIQHMPYSDDFDAEFHAQVGVFLAEHGDSNAFLRASSEARNLIGLCQLENDFSEIVRILPEQRGIIEAMFKRFGFECQTVS